MSRVLIDPAVRDEAALLARIELERRRRAAASAYEKKLTDYAGDPVGFAHEVLGIEFLTPEQEAIFLSVLHNRETNVPAGHGVGKSFGSAALVLWWVFAVEGLCITTAPNKEQVNDILWREIRNLYDNNKQKLGGERTVLSVKKSEAALAKGFTSRDYDENTFQGRHHAKLLVILDEANGITEEIDDGASASTTGYDNRLVRIGNPVVGGTPFESACKFGCIRIPVWNHPNVAWAYEVAPDGVHRLKSEVKERIFTSEDRLLPLNEWPMDFRLEVVPGAVSVMWIEETRKKKGEKSPYWLSRVEAHFPTDSEYSVIPKALFIEARNRYDSNQKYWDEQAEKFEWGYGFDVGDVKDSHASASWRGPVLYAVRNYPVMGDHLEHGRAMGYCKKLLAGGHGRIYIDNNGVGAGLYSALLEEKQPVSGVRWSEGADDDRQYVNLKAEQWGLLRDDLLAGRRVIAGLGENEGILLDEFSKTYFETMRDGRLKIEPKEKTRRRLGRSPNIADAAVMGASAQSRLVGTPWKMNRIFY